MLVKFLWCYHSLFIDNVHFFWRRKGETDVHIEWQTKRAGDTVVKKGAIFFLKQKLYTLKYFIVSVKA
jgi:hypothetical protein